MARPFVEELADLEGGRLIEDLTAGMSDLIAQVMAVRKGGTLTLKIGILPNGETSVEVRGKIDINAPEPARESTIMFVDPEGGLRRDNPRQLRLPIDIGDYPDVKEIKSKVQLREVQ
jgi:hypothetical protein